MNLEIILSATIIVLLVIIFILVVNKSNIKLDTKIDKRKRRSHKKNFKKASQVEIKALQALVKYALNHYSRIGLAIELKISPGVVSYMLKGKMVRQSSVNKHTRELMDIVDRLESNKNK